MRVPHVLVILFAMTVATALTSLVVPAGSYQRDAEGHVLAGTYAPLSPSESASRPRGLSLAFAVLSAPLEGTVAAASILAFVFAVGGAFRIVEKSGAFDAAVRWGARRAKGRERVVLPLMMLLFSAGGAVFGMSEEVVPFVLLLVPMVRALGYPAIVAVAVPLVGSGVGFAGAMINPFTVGVAQAIAGLPPLSGWELRSVVWLLLTAAGIAYVMRGAERLRRAARAEGRAHEAKTDEEDVQLTRTHLGVFAVLALGFVAMIGGISALGWYVIEIGAVFLAMGIAAGMVARIGADTIAEAFTEGARDLLPAGIVVGVGRGIVELASRTGILDTLLHGISSGLAALPPLASAEAMFAFQSLLNFLVPSGSGQAALTMPIMAPLSDLLGVSRQVAVLAFQFGDGFTNLITPTSAVLMGCLAIARVPYAEWLRFAGRLQLWLGVIGAVCIAVAVLVDWR